MCQRPIKSNPAIYSQYRLALSDCLLQVLADRPGVLFYASLSAVSLRQRHLRGECMRDHELVLWLAELIKAGPEAAEAQGVDRSTYERGRTASAWPRRRLTTPAVNRSRSRPASPPLAVWAGAKRCAPWPRAKASSTRTLTAPTPPTRKRGAEGKAPVRSSAQVLPRKSPLPTENHEQAPQIR